MLKHHITNIEADDNCVLIVEHVSNAEKQFCINEWLKDHVTTKRMKEFVTSTIIRYNDVHYSMVDFLEMLQDG